MPDYFKCFFHAGSSHDVISIVACWLQCQVGFANEEEDKFETFIFLMDIREEIEPHAGERRNRFVRIDTGARTWKAILPK